jgi:hypothetical protein
VANAHIYTEDRQDDHLKYGTRNILERLKIMGRIPNLPFMYRSQDTDVRTQKRHLMCYMSSTEEE